ncbi:MAG: hypothetical protein MUP27_01785, partial [Desulfobacterales bacterium]|nr:hypothetical protein [Desulfobacterales bacterium]
MVLANSLYILDDPPLIHPYPQPFALGSAIQDFESPQVLDAMYSVWKPCTSIVNHCQEKKYRSVGLSQNVGTKFGNNDDIVNAINKNGPFGFCNLPSPSVVGKVRW